MKKAAGAIRLELAQYREMEIFTQFSSDLDDTAKRQLNYGKGLMELLKQKQFKPMSGHQQVIVLVAALNHIMQDIPLGEIAGFKEGLISYIEGQAPYICEEIDKKGVLTDEIKENILELAQKFFKSLKSEETR